MDMRSTVMSLLLATGACSSPGSVTEKDRRAATAGISVVLDSMNAAWRRADFVAAADPILDKGVITLNGFRAPAGKQKAVNRRSPTGGIAGQYIGDYTPRYDVLTSDLAVTTSENDFARIAMDSSRGPMQVALMTIVWKRTPDGWRILYTHESTRPKALKRSVELLAPYTGTYQSTNAPDVRFTLAGDTMFVTMGNTSPVPLEPFTDPNLGMRNRGGMVTFVRNRDGTVNGVLLASSNGSSRYAWRVPAVGERQ